MSLAWFDAKRIQQGTPPFHKPSSAQYDHDLGGVHHAGQIIPPGRHPEAYYAAAQNADLGCHTNRHGGWHFAAEKGFGPFFILV